MRADLHYKRQQLGWSFTHAQSQTRLIRDVNWLACLGPSSLQYSAFQTSQISSDPTWETELRYVLRKVCVMSMFWRGIVALGCSVPPNEKYALFQLQCITTPISDGGLPSTPKSERLGEVECHLRGPHRISALVLGTLKKSHFPSLMLNPVPLLSFTI